MHVVKYRAGFIPALFYGKKKMDMIEEKIKTGPLAADRKLLFAIFQRDEEMAIRAIQSGANKNAQLMIGQTVKMDSLEALSGNEFGTLTMYAFQNGLKKLADFLLGVDADLTLLDNGQTVLRLSNNDPRVIQKLKEQQARKIVVHPIRIQPGNLQKTTGEKIAQ